jgi:hypothetical protein
MTRTQVQLPDPLYKKLKAIAEQRDWSLAELLRRAAEAYLLTLPDDEACEAAHWQLPVLKPSGGYVRDPAKVRGEEEVIFERLTGEC